MGKVTLITGGARSGKSSHALTLAGTIAGKEGDCLFVATAQALDDEMRARIEHHRAVRPQRFQTLEEPLALAAAIDRQVKASVVVIDCLTLWISNLMGAGFDDQQIIQHGDVLVASLGLTRSASIVVTDEVGSGIVPEAPLARRFRDLLGWTNQRIAAAADSVLLMVVGLPVQIK
jgi:adenosylcobinamide kinase/adenosylcobinamide-phosphate guanylyltransferase